MAQTPSDPDWWTGWTRNKIVMERLATASARATGTPAQSELPTGPSPGTFSFGMAPLAGSNPPKVALASGMTETSNPITVNLVAAGPMKTPTPGGLGQLIANYVLTYAHITNTTTNDANNIAAFGMSCYMVALQSDYGSPPNNCSSTRINGVRYSGSVTDPYGLMGTYCSSFIANVRLQGTGQLNSGAYVHYSTASNTISVVSTVTGADGTPVVAGRTVARDRAVIPQTGVYVDVNGVGNGLLANDTGDAIVGYRLDLFNGAGVTACANYSNPIAIGLCNPEQTGTCPTGALK